MDSTEHKTTETAPAPASLSPVPAAAPRDSTTLDTSIDSDAQTVIEKDANGFSYYPCRFCGLTFNYMNTLRAHERVHDVAQPYKCSQCNEAFHFACELEYHAQQHKDSKGYGCDCGRRFFSYTEMLYHKHPEDAPLRDMPEIMAAPSTSAAAAAAPAAAGPFPPITDRDFPTPAYATEGYEPKHPLRVYSDIRSRPYICEYCSKSYPDSRQLATHMYSHRGEKIFNPRASRYLIGRQGVGYVERPSHFLY